MTLKNEYWNFLSCSILNSYSQIFFSKKKVFAILVLIATFLNPELGLWGLLGVVFTNILAHGLGFNKHTIKEGLYGLNSLLVVLGLSVFFKVNVTFIFVFIIKFLNLFE